MAPRDNPLPSAGPACQDFTYRNGLPRSGPTRATLASHGAPVALPRSGPTRATLASHGAAVALPRSGPTRAALASHAASVS